MATFAVSMAKAVEYFAGRLHTEAWDQATEDARQRALLHAGRVISALPLRMPVPQDIIIPAICEQALYLLELSTADLERVRAQRMGVSSRTVGDAHESYTGYRGLLSLEVKGLLGAYFQRRAGRII